MSWQFLAGGGKIRGGLSQKLAKWFKKAARLRLYQLMEYTSAK